MTRIAATVAAVVALGSLAAAPAGAAVLKGFWGPLTMPNGSSAFPVYDKLGVNVFQYQLLWDRVARTRPANPADPNDPAYHWPAPLDGAMRDASRRGIQFALMVKGTPPWANGGQADTYAPDNASDYADFMSAAARRYPSVRRWMIWGEANRGLNFQPMPVDSPVGPRRYALLLDAAYRALKRVNRRNVVIGGMTFTYGDVKPVDFLRWMVLPSGRRPLLDEWGHNPFSRRLPQIGATPSFPNARDMGDTPRFVREVHRAYRGYARFRRSGPKLWLSEFTVSSDRPNRAFNFAVSRNEQAKWLTAAFRIANHTPGISGLGWFNLYDEPASTPDGLTTGLMTYEGQRKPAFYAYERAR